MQELLLERLNSYIRENNPDLLVSLQDTFSLRKYLEDRVALVTPTMQQLLEEGKPQYIIEELCLNEMTKELRPSKFNYMKEVLEAEFAATYRQYEKAGVLTYELLNILDHCKSVFDKHQFSEESEESRLLRYEVTGCILAYLSSN